jgi:flagellar motor switch protein FliG
MNPLPQSLPNSEFFMETSSTVRDAAIVLRQLPRLQAAQVMSRIGARELNAIFREIDRLNSTSSEEVVSALNRAEIEVNLLEQTKPRRPKFQELEDVNQQQSAGDTDNSCGSSFGFLLGYNPDLVDQVIRDEHPKHIASVLARLPPEVASAQLRRLDSVQRVAVVRRICELENQPAVDCAALASALKRRLNRILAANANAPKSGVSIAARLVQVSEPETHNPILPESDEKTGELLDNHQATRFQFAELASFSEQDMKALLRKVDTGLWAPALSSAPLEVRHNVLSNMAPKAAQILVREIRQLDGATANDSRIAQQKILAACSSNSLPSRFAD